MRKVLSLTKGGKLAQAAFPAKVYIHTHTLYIHSYGMELSWTNGFTIQYCSIHYIWCYFSGFKLIRFGGY